MFYKRPSHKSLSNLNFFFFLKSHFNMISTNKKKRRNLYLLNTLIILKHILELEKKKKKKTNFKKWVEYVKSNTPINTKQIETNFSFSDSNRERKYTSSFIFFLLLLKYNFHHFLENKKKLIKLHRYGLKLNTSNFHYCYCHFRNQLRTSLNYY